MSRIIILGGAGSLGKYMVEQVVIPYADAAEFMLNNLQPANAMARHRVGLALPLGMRGQKERWSARSAVPQKAAVNEFTAWYGKPA